MMWLLIITGSPTHTELTLKNNNRVRRQTREVDKCEDVGESKLRVRFDASIASIESNSWFRLAWKADIYERQCVQEEFFDASEHSHICWYRLRILRYAWNNKVHLDRWFRFSVCIPSFFRLFFYILFSLRVTILSHWGRVWGMDDQKESNGVWCCTAAR